MPTRQPLQCHTTVTTDHPNGDDDDLQSLEWLANFDVRRITNLLNPEQQKDDSVDSKMAITSSSSRTDLRCTFTCMIFRAIDENPDRALSLQSIYRWIEERYPRLAKNGSKWKNSVRHSLTLNRRFIRLQRRPEDSRKSSWWTLRTEFRKANDHRNSADESGHICVQRQGAGPRVKNEPGSGISLERTVPISIDDIKAAETILSLREARNGRDNTNRILTERKQGKKRWDTRRRKSQTASSSLVIDSDHSDISENANRIDTQRHLRSRTLVDAGVQVSPIDFEFTAS